MTTSSDANVNTTSQSNAQGNAQGVVQIKKIAKKRHSQEAFITAYQLSDSNQEVADKLNVTLSCVLSRSKKYREMGINIKKMTTQRKKIDVQSANDFIARLNAKMNAQMETQKEAKKASQPTK